MCRNCNRAFPFEDQAGVWADVERALLDPWPKAPVPFGILYFTWLNVCTIVHVCFRLLFYVHSRVCFSSVLYWSLTVYFWIFLALILF
jgi:hypothetical protein